MGVLSRFLTGVPTVKRRLGRPGCRWEDNSRMDLGEIGNNTRSWVNSTQDRDYWRALVNAPLNLWVAEIMELVSNIYIYLFK